MNPLALMNLGLAPIPTFQPKPDHNLPESVTNRMRVAEGHRAKVVEKIERDGPMGNMQVRALCQCSEKTAERYLAALVKQGLLTPVVVKGRVAYDRSKIS